MSGPDRALVAAAAALVSCGLCALAGWRPAALVFAAASVALSFGVVGYAARVVSQLARRRRRCRVCGCTDRDCRRCIRATGMACHWVERDLCSRCQAHVATLIDGALR